MAGVMQGCGECVRMRLMKTLELFGLTKDRNPWLKANG